MTLPYTIEPLARHHERVAFTCGSVPLDEYIKKRASQDIRRHIAIVYVLCEPNSPVVRGCYTLSASSIELQDLPSELARRLPQYPLLPAALIGRLAVDHYYHGQGLGEHLLMDALYRCVQVSNQMGTLAVLVDAKDDTARAFYERYGFLRFADHEYRLFLPMQTIKQSFVLG